MSPSEKDILSSEFPLVLRIVVLRPKDVAPATHPVPAIRDVDHGGTTDVSPSYKNLHASE